MASGSARPSPAVSAIDLDVCFDDAIHRHLREWYDEGELKRMYRALVRAPRSICMRVDERRISAAAMAEKLNEHLTAFNGALVASGREPVRARVDERVPCAVLVVGSLSTLREDPVSLPEVLVDIKCGESVLRGSDVFVKGIVGLPDHLQAGQRVAVNVDLDRVMPRGYAAHRYEGRRVFVGVGVAQMTRRGVLRAERGLGVRMEQRVGADLPPMNGFEPELYVLQNLPSAATGHCVGASPGDLVLDMCSCPGGKSTHLATDMRGSGLLISCDQSRTKIKRLRARLAERGLAPPCEAYVVDATGSAAPPSAWSGAALVGGGVRARDATAGAWEDAITGGARSTPRSVPDREAAAALAEAGSSDALPLAERARALRLWVGEAQSAVRLHGFPPEVFDRILLDPPCSGLGLRPRLKPAEDAASLEFLPRAQAAMAWNACLLLRPGGRLVFSTCTVNPGENEAQVASILERFPWMTLVPSRAHVGISGRPVCGLSEEEARLVQRFDPGLCPDVDTTGFFIATFVKTRSALTNPVALREALAAVAGDS